MSAQRLERDARTQAAWAVLDGVPDPELPVLSLTELAVVRDVRVQPGGVEVVLTPTYSGCPAVDAMRQDIVNALTAAGLGPVKVTLQRAPAWSTDWMSAEARRKLREHGIAPPGPAGQGVPLRFVARTIECPRCGSAQTEQLSAFGGTACKSLWRCLACSEPFEHFKPS